MDPLAVVRIELQRIQTFLFAVPRLRAMLGANALLGHTLRHVLPQKATGVFAPPYQPGTPGPTDDPLDATNLPLSDGLPDRDDPAACYQRGILSRDGGHLTIAFGDEGSARAFIAAAYAELARALPELPVSIRLTEWTRKDEPDAGIEQTPGTAQVAEIPQFQGCTESGFGVAKVRDTDKDTDAPIYRSRQAEDKTKAGLDFQCKPSKFKDLVSLLQRQLPGYVGHKNPDDLKDLSDAGGYIALVHADGNRIGQRLSDHRWPFKGDPLKYEVETEHFFHHMRVTARASVVAALTKVFDPETLDRHKKCIPYQLLMLGGDDLLLLCQPQYALPFTVAYAQALKARPALPDGKPLSIGAGIVIAQHSLPFHRLHALAEGLAGSAKRAYLQGLPCGKDSERSVADWTILTTSWGEDPLTQRRRDDRVEYRLGDDQTETLALSAKPYFVLTEDLTDPHRQVSLEQLVGTADRFGPPAAPGVDALSSADLPRSQLKYLVGQLGQGRRWADLCFQEVRGRLGKEYVAELDGCVTRNGALWQQDTPDGHRYLTHLRDLIELTELRFLGRRKQEFDLAEAEREAATVPPTAGGVDR